MKAWGLVLGVMMLTAGPALADVPPSLGTTPCGAAQPVRILPIMATHQIPPYPPESVQAREQGNSVLRVAIAPDGHVVEDSIVQSSGSARLDSAALDYVKQNWRWQPMPDCKLPVSVAVSVSWRLRGGMLDGLDPALMLKLVSFLPAGAGDYPPGGAAHRAMVPVMAMLSEKGEVLNTVVLRESGDLALDARSAELVRQRKFSPLMLDGRPAGSFAFIAVIWTPPGETPPDPEQIGKVMQLLMPPR